MTRVIVASVLIVLLGGFMIFALPYEFEHSREPIVVESDNSHIEKWVYTHSKLISNRTVKSVVKQALSYKHGYLMIAMMEHESQGFNPVAVSSANCVGLGQINYGAHKEALGKIGIKEARDLFDVDTNLRAMDFLLTDFFKRSGGNIDQVMALYLGKKSEWYMLKIYRNYVELMEASK